MLLSAKLKTMAGALAVVERKHWVQMALAAVGTVAAGLAHGRTGDVVAFGLAAVALSLVAVVVGEATEQMGAKLSPGATGVLHGALGNLPELMVCFFSLRAGLVEVVKSALIGSIVANSVLVLGLALLLGGLKHGTLKFRSEPPRMTAVLMLLAATALAVPTLTFTLGTPAARHEEQLSVVCAVVLLVLFAASLSFFIRGDKELTPEPDPEEATQAHWPLWFSCVVLALAGVAAAFVSEWFVAALEPATRAMGLSEAFTGLVVVAVAGNAIENLVGIQLALKNKPDLAVSVVLNSSLQIALLVIPVLVIASLFIASTPLTLVLSPLLLVVMLFAAVVPAFVVFDGDAIWLEGAALVGLYVLFAAAFWWG